MIIDSQIHAYEANTPARPWTMVPAGWPPLATRVTSRAARTKVSAAVLHIKDHPARRPSAVRIAPIDKTPNKNTITNHSHS